MPCISQKAAVPIVVLLGVACTSDMSTEPSVPIAEAAIAEAAISARADDGNPHFRFLPPLARARSTSGTFDPSQTVTVEVCRLSGRGCGNIVATFRTGERGRARVSVSASDEHYHANWKTSRYLAGATYRIQVAAGAMVLGTTDVYLAGKRRQAPAGVFVARAGSTIPIKFRIEEGAVSQSDVEVTLTWDNAGDMDLHVIDPTGFHIYFGDPVSPSGGQLDADNTSGFGPETISWPTGAAPAGAYQVSVAYFSGEVSPINFTVAITANGATQTYQGQVFEPGQSVEVVTFNVGGAATMAAEPLPVIRRLLQPTGVVPLAPKTRGR